MKNEVLASIYVTDVKRGIWSRPDYTGIAYSDGDEAETRIAEVIDKATDITVLSPELRQHCTDWPFLYHLSGTRANILRPFEASLKGNILEIGSGCGAITRYLGESGANILALEGSPRRAAITRSRTRDLENVTVLTEKFDQFQSDYQFGVITLIGVLEYANLFTVSENPALAMLRRVRSLLKPEGILIIAIENQLGLKYFAGAPEDHLGQPMYGIEGRYTANQPETFGRVVLADLLEEAGFPTAEFLAPFPDYKLPVSILTTKGLSSKEFDGAALAWQSVRRDPQLPSSKNFSLELTWPGIFKNGLALDMANSFLVAASPLQQHIIKLGILGYHYSTDRAPQYCKEAVFEHDDENTIAVNYRKLDVRQQKDEPNQIIDFTCPEKVIYTKGAPLSLEFVRIVTRDGWSIEEVGVFIQRYVNLLSIIASQKGYPAGTRQLADRLPGDFFDIVPQNIIVSSAEKPVVIDIEWSLKGDIELGLLIFRSLLWGTGSVSFGENSAGNFFSRSMFIKSALGAAGYLPKNEDLLRFQESEAVIQQQVTGRPSREFLIWWLKQPLLTSIRTMAKRDDQIASLNHVITEREDQITRTNQTLTERNKLIASLYNSTSWRITSPLRAMVRRLKEVRHAATPAARRAATHLVKQCASNSAIRSCYASAQNISSKAIYPVFPELHELIFVKLKLYLRSHYLHGDRSSSIFASESLYWPKKSVPVDFNPKVSVIVPSYNHARFLRQRLDSIYQQTYSNFEVILLDDSSTDESQIILEEYRQRYPKITQCEFNKNNSGGVFNQWKRGFEIASGDLIWIAESDDYCSENLVTELVKYFADNAVMLAYCRTTFVEKESAEPIWSLEEFLAELDPDLWRKAFVMSAHHLVNKAWAIKNVIPNVSSAIFRHPRKLELLENEKWKQMRICGDWIFYLHLTRGGIVAYTPEATNYYRLHQTNTSLSTYSQDVYYQEHEQVAAEIIALYRVDDKVFERQRHLLESHWHSHRTDYSNDSFKKCYDFERIRHLSIQRKPNLLMASFALIAGGGETFPIKLANMLAATGYGITFLNCHHAPTEEGIRQMLRGDIPLLELDTLEKLSAVIDDMGIELVHSHHGSVDVNVCYFLEHNRNSRLIVTTHGMYEMIPPDELAGILPLLKKRVDKFVYTADKNLAAFEANHFDLERFVKIDNALDITPTTPIPRSELGVPEDAFLICLVSRAIPEKGWQEAIEAVRLAREINGKNIHLLLIGEGPEYERLISLIKDKFIHFLGFRANIRDYFATSDLGFLPSRFRGESFPLVLIDCFHSNRPMLASNIGEINRMMSTHDGPAGTVFDLKNWNIPVTQVSEIIAAYAEDKNLYLDHLHRVSIAAAKFDPAILLKNYESVYLELHNKNICIDTTI